MKHISSSPSALQHPLSKLLPRYPKGPMRVPARLLGWFSVALGLAELAAPRALASAAGVPDTRAEAVRGAGLREVGVGLALLNTPHPAPWLWARVAGDVVDIASVLPALGGRRPARAALSLAALAGVAALDLVCAIEASKGPRKATRDYRDRSGFPKHPLEMRGAAGKAKAA